MSDWARTRSPGERFSIPAEAYNRWTEASLRGNINSPNGGTQISDGAGKNDTGRVQVKNGTGGALSRYDVVSINDGVVLSPTAAENEFLSRPIFAAGTPDRYTVRWGVIQQPLADEQIGMAVVTGLTPVRLNVTTDTLYRYATVTASSDYLVPSNDQGARLLYREAGTGEVWALVDVGHMAMHAAPFLGYVDEDGDLQIAGGNVYSEDDNATAVAAYDAAVQASKWYYVQAAIDLTDDNSVSVTGTIQVAASEPDFVTRTSTTLTIKWLIGTTDANSTWSQRWGGGDIYLDEWALALGVTDDYDEDAVSDVELDANQITFPRRNAVVELENGLVKAADLTDADARVVTSDGKWLKVNAAGVSIEHTNMGTDDSEDWQTIDLSTDTPTLIFDNNGHLRKVDSTPAPGPNEAYKCRQCGTTDTFIYREADPGAFFMIADVCYERIGLVVTIEELNTGTITDTYASCAACLDAADNYLWVLCSDGTTTAAIFSEGNQPGDNYAWVWTGTDYVKAQYDRMTATAATDPCFVGTNDAAPADCDDVVSDYFTDEFTGAGFDDCMWDGDTAWAGWSYTGGKLRGFSDSNVGFKRASNRGRWTVDSSEPVCIETELATFTVEDFASYKQAGIDVYFTNRYQLAIYTNGSQYVLEYTDGVGGQHTENLGTSLSLPIVMKIDRDVSNDVRIYFGGVQKGSTRNDSGAMQTGNDRCSISHGTSQSQDFTTEWNYFRVTT